MKDIEKHAKILAEFVETIIRDGCWEGGYMDGGDIEQMAEVAGLIVPHQATQDNAEDWALIDEVEEGGTFYTLAPWLENLTLTPVKK